MEISIPIEIVPMINSSKELDGPEEYLASIPCMPGMVATGITSDEARTELIKSLAVKLAYDYGIYGYHQLSTPNLGNASIKIDIR